jgi:hypothetical protein
LEYYKGGDLIDSSVSFKHGGTTFLSLAALSTISPAASRCFAISAIIADKMIGDRFFEVKIFFLKIMIIHEIND